MSVTVPNQGDPTKLSLVAAIIAEQNSLAALTYAVATLGVVSNGSFELGTPTPSGWTFTAQTAGVGAIDDTTSGHGAKSFKMTSLGGGANGGGELEMSDFVECSPQVSLLFRWQTKSSVAGVKNLVEVDWFSSADVGDFISTTTLWSSDNNPTDWTVVGATATPPATARYFKLRLIGCDSSDSTAGDAWFDDVVVQAGVFQSKIEFSTAGTYSWLCPPGVYFARVTMTGPGGNGGGSAVNGGGGGGGGGGTGRSVRSVTPGTVYTVVIGAPDSNSTFDTTAVIGNSGSNGSVGGGGAGGAGGAGGGATGDQVYTGATGQTGIALNVGSTGGAGGPSLFGCGGAVPTGAVAGNAGFRGGGGSGAAQSGSGGAGGGGYGLIEY